MMRNGKRKAENLQWINEKRNGVSKEKVIKGEVHLKKKRESLGTNRE